MPVLDLLDLPAAYWHELVHVLTTGSVRIPDHLRTVLVYGEAVLPERIAQWRGLAGDRIRLLNGYGPTEAVVCNCATIVHDPDEIERLDPFDPRIPYDWSLKHR